MTEKIPSSDPRNPEALISVIVSIFQGKKFISELVQTLHFQTYKNWECLVCDDGSQDGTLDYFRQKVNEDPRFIFISKTHEGLPSRTRNVAMMQAKGDLLAFLDYDDYWHPRKLEFHAAGMQKYPSCFMSFSRHASFWNELPKIDAIDHVSFEEKNIFGELVKRNFLAFSAVVIRKEVLKVCGYFDPRSELKAVEDYFYWLSISKKLSALKLNAVLAFHREHASGISRNHTQMVEGLKTIAKLWEQKFPKSSELRYLYAQAQKSEAKNLILRRPHRALQLLISSLWYRYLNI